MALIPNPKPPRPLFVAFRRALREVRSAEDAPTSVSVAYNLHTSSKKMQPICRFVSGMTLKEAIMQTHAHSKKAANMLSYVLRKSERDAVEGMKMNKDLLVINNLLVARGDVMKDARLYQGKVNFYNRQFLHVRVVLRQATPEQYQCFLDYEAFMTKKDLWEKHRQEWLELNPPETHGKRMPFQNRSTSVDSRLEGYW
eukprot:RCo022563